MSTLCPSPFSLSWFSFEGRRTKSPQTHCSGQNHLTQVEPELSKPLNPPEWQQGTWQAAQTFVKTEESSPYKLS